MKGGYSNTIVLEHLKKDLEFLLEGKMCLTEGVRGVAQWRWSNHGLNEEFFSPFVGVDSETDRFPVGKVRELWSAEALAKADAERDIVEARYRNWMMECGSKLLEAVNTALLTSTFSDPCPT